MEQKKTLLIVNNNMKIGGIQKSLLNLLKEIKDKYDVTLFLFYAKGDYMTSIPAGVNVIPANKMLCLLGMSQSEAKELGIFYYLLRIVLSGFAKLFTNRIPISLLVQTEKIRDFYDCAISFMQNSSHKILYSGCNEFVLKSTSAKRKISVVHCDYSKYDGRSSYNDKLYSKFDTIAAVSEGCKNSFLSVLPWAEEKIFCVYNCHDYNEIEIMSNDNTFVYDTEHMHAVTVARLSNEKGIIRCIKYFVKLKDEGIKVKWHIIGDGYQKDIVNKCIIDNGLEDTILLYGNQVNPYRFMKGANFFILPSYHEAAPMVFNESKFLCLPVLTTNTTSAEEMIGLCEAGWVCDNDDEAIYIALKDILSDYSKIKAVKNRLSLMKYNNERAVNQFEIAIKGKQMCD